MSKQIELWCCLFFNGFKPLDHGCCIFPLVEFGCSRNFAVDSVEDCFADSTYLRFGGVNYRQVGLLAKFGLWSFSVMNASLLAVMSTLSSMPSFVAMFLFSEWMACVVLGCAFL